MVDPAKLTKREEETLPLFVSGYSNREAGEKLNISHRTVEAHRRNIREKVSIDLGIDVSEITRQVLVQWARRRQEQVRQVIIINFFGYYIDETDSVSLMIGAGAL